MCKKNFETLLISLANYNKHIENTLWRKGLKNQNPVKYKNKTI